MKSKRRSYLQKNTIAKISFINKSGAFKNLEGLANLLGLAQKELEGMRR
jgi:hypothetical protein